MAECPWRPSEARILSPNMTQLMEEVGSDWNVTITDFDALYRFSFEKKEKFWQSLKGFCVIIAETWGTVVPEHGDRMPGARWFPGARLNFAENLLRHRDDGHALVFQSEDRVRRRMNCAELHTEVSRLSQAMREACVTAGDRIAGMMLSMPEAAITMLAATSIGANWSSWSPDFGIDGVIDRFGQIEPKLLFAPDGYYDNGKPVVPLWWGETQNARSRHGGRRARHSGPTAARR